MAERFGDAALRHLETAELLGEQGRIDDSAYHYGLVGETALKAAIEKALLPLPKALRRHINDRKGSLQSAIQKNTDIISLLGSGRLGGALKAEFDQGFLDH